jgi:hypothetical protein
LPQAREEGEGLKSKIDGVEGLNDSMFETGGIYSGEKNTNKTFDQEYLFRN